MAALISEIKSYVSLAGDNDVTPREDQSVLVASPTECRLVFGHENTPSKASSRNSSYSEENRLSEGARVGEEKGKRVRGDAHPAVAWLRGGRDLLPVEER